MPVSGRRLAVVALVVTMIVWGSSFVVTKLVLDEAGPFAVTVLRFGFGLSVLLPFAYRRGFRFRLVLEPTFLLFGLTGVALVYGLQTLALVFTSAANTALISAGVPVVAAVLAYVFLEEPIPPARLFGIGISVLGVGLVSGTMPSGANSGSVLLGNALMVGAVVAYGAYAVQGRALRSGERYPAVLWPRRRASPRGSSSSSRSPPQRWSSPARRNSERRDGSSWRTWGSGRPPCPYSYGTTPSGTCPLAPRRSTSIWCP